MPQPPACPPLAAAIVGAGPAGLMAAQTLAAAGVAVDVFDAMPSAGRKFLLAGKGGLNLTHSEPLPAFIGRYGPGPDEQAAIARWLHAFGPQAVRDWAAELGVSTFIGSSGRVFPQEMKAAPLLRAWLHRLRQPAAPGAAPVRFHMRHRCIGLARPHPQAAPGLAGVLQFESPQGPRSVPARAILLALGGASWPQLGSDGAWADWLAQAAQLPIAPLRPANCGFDVPGGWSDHFARRFAGQAFKNVRLRFAQDGQPPFDRQGEFVATATGVEGSLIYAASARLREAIARQGPITCQLDLLPARSPAQVLAALQAPRGRQSLGSHLRKKLKLDAIKTALLHERLPPADLQNPPALAAAIKALPLLLSAPRPVQEAISTAGGVPFAQVSAALMLRTWPGLFVAGEMLDWEAPTGGYLLTACLSSGRHAGQGMARWLQPAFGAAHSDTKI